MAMRRFRVLEGKHYESMPQGPDDKTDFVKGDIVESEKDLTKKFVNKFEEVTWANTPRPTITPERTKAIDKMVQDEMFMEVDRVWLEVIPEERFRQMFDADRKASHLRSQAEHGASDTPPIVTQNVLGEDVSEQFKSMKDGTHRVFRNAAGKHQVVRTDAPTKPINKEALDAGHVDSFMEEYGRPTTQATATPAPAPATTTGKKK